MGSDDGVEPRDQDGSLEAAIEEHLAAQEDGVPIDPEELIARYPLHGTELREFLARDGTIGAALRGASAAMEAGAPPGLGGPAGPDGFRPPRTIGDYDVLEPIAAGGMGVVYRARQRSLGRIVALKTLGPGPGAGEDRVRRFQREARAAALLHHPNIVPIHEVGEDAGVHFFSMAYVGGGNLAQRGESFRRDPAGAARLIELAARAIHYAHLRGVLHRDIKPANILLDEDGSPFISDFGLAHVAAEASNLTLPGTIVGTLAYMAPEQAAGSGRDLTAAADVYSLGVLLYEMLTGTPPHEGKTSAELLWSVQKEEAIPPRRRDPSIPRDLEVIVLKCLEKDPRRRYASAAGLADDLERFQAGIPVEARRRSGLARGWGWCRRNPGPAAAALLLVCLATGAIVAAALLRVAGDRAREALRAAHLERARLAVASGAAGRRAMGLRAIDAAIELRAPTSPAEVLELRSLAASCLGLADLEAEDGVRGESGEPASGRSEGRARRPRVGRGAGGEADVPLAPPRARWSRGARHLLSAVHAEDGARLEVEEQALGITRVLGTLQSPRAWDLLRDGERVVRVDAGGSWTVERVDGGSAGEPVPAPSPLDRTHEVACAPGDDGVLAAGPRRGEGGHAVVLMDLPSGTIRSVYPVSWVPEPLAWHPGGKAYAVGVGLTVHIVDAATGKLGKLLRGHHAAPVAIAFSGVDPLLASASREGTMILWSHETGEPVVSAHAGVDGALSIEGRSVLLGAGPRSAARWRVVPSPERQVLQEARRRHGSVDALAFSPDGRLLAVGGEGGLTLRSTLDGSRLLLWQDAAIPPIEEVRFSGDGGRIIASFAGGRRVFELERDESSLEFTTVAVRQASREAAAARESSAGESACGVAGADRATAIRAGVAAVVDSPRHVRLVDLDRGEDLVLLSPPDAHLVRTLAITEDGRLLAVAFESNGIHLWDLEALRGALARRGLEWLRPRSAGEPDALWRKPVRPGRP